MKIPNWLSSHLNEEKLKAIREAVTLAESHTTGEIVPMIVRRSSPLTHMMGMLFFIFVACLEVAFFVYSSQVVVDRAFEIQFVLVLVSLIGAGLLSRVESVQRILTPKSDRIHNSLVRAELEFHRSKIRETNAHTGVLLFVSVMERQAVVLADEKIVKKLGDHSWDGVLETLLQGLKAQDFAVGFSKAIEQIGQILKDSFPANQHSQNDLPNDLQIKD